MKITLIRHGETAANRQHRFLGLTDEPLTAESRAKLRSRHYPAADRLFVSPLLRCRQTADLIYPGQAQQVLDGLREMDFGLFEGRTNEELLAEPYYQAWLDQGRADFPGGETMEAFQERCLRAFRQAAADIKEEESAAFVIHGGTIMVLMSNLCGGNFYDYLCGNGDAYCCRYEQGRLLLEEKR